MNSRLVYWWRRALGGLAEPVFLAFVVGLSFRKQLFDTAVFPWDFQGRMSAGPTFVAANISNGNWPSWNPFQGSGEPMATNIGAGLYYPAHWVAGLLDIPLTLRLQAVLQVAHVWGGAVGAWMLARALGLSRQASLLAGTAFALWGGFYGQATHMHHIRGFAMIPFMLWAVTPHHGRFVMRRLLWLAPLYYLLASGGYPGQLVPFTIGVAVYAAAHIWRVRSDVSLPQVLAVGVAFVASGVAALVVIWPFLSSSDLLFRAVEPNVAGLERNTYGLDDIGRFWLNFRDKVVLATWVATPILLGLGLVRRDTLRRCGPLLIAGAASTVVLLLPHAGFFGRLFDTPLGPMLYPSRFPGADHKSLLAIVVIVASSSAWDRWSTSTARWAIMAMVPIAGLLVGGIWIDWFDDRDYTLHPVVLAIVVGLTVALAAFAYAQNRAGNGRPAVVAWLPVVVLVLVVVDGTRQQSDGLRYPIGNPVDAWTVEIDLDERYGWEIALDETLREVRSQRPARTLPIETDRPQGRPQEALGYIEPEFRMGSYGGHTVDARVRAYENLEVFDFLEQASGFLTRSCEQNCDIELFDDAWSQASTTRDIEVLDYGLEHITYRSTLTESALVVENEIAYPGWTIADERVTLLDNDWPLRSWRAEAGSYEFTARYESPFKVLQLSLLAAAVAGQLVLIVLLRPRAPKSSRASEVS